MLSSISGPRTVLVTGHESAGGADLPQILDALPGAVLASSGRALHDAVAALLDTSADPVVVVPMTWGRDPGMVADTAKTLSWLSVEAGPGRLAQSADFGTADHLVAWLRRAATQTRQRPGVGMIVTAPSANPFDDAELHRIAHLVRTHGAGVPVEVACVTAPEDLAQAVRRSQVLGSTSVVIVPAGFASTAPHGLPDRATFFGPLLSEQALLEVISRRVASAVHQLGHGHDGIATGLVADHGHGYAHSHAFDLGPQGHTHPPLGAALEPAVAMQRTSPGASEEHQA